MKKLIAVLFVLVSGCIDERAVVRAAFDGCDGHEEAFHEKWSECMKLGGDVRGLRSETRLPGQAARESC